MSIKNLFPSVKPTADFNFAATKTLDSRLLFSRASSASYFDGSVVKVEENLRTNSTTVPSQVETVKTDDATTTPGGYKACLLTPNTVNAYHTGGYQSVYANAALDYVFSFVCKSNGYSKIRVGNTATSTLYATFDLNAISVGSTGGSAYLASGILDIGNGWRRCWIKANHSTAQLVEWAVTPFPDGAVVDEVGRASFAGDGVSGAYFGEFQVEQRSFLGPHLPTGVRPISNYMSKLVSAVANEPRFVHDPLSRECLGLLFEEQRTNLFTYSSDFLNSSWVKSNCLISPSVAFSPEGLITASKVYANTSNSTHYFLKSYTSSSGTYSASIFVKSAGITKFKLYLNDNLTGDANANVDLIAKTCTASKSGSWTNNTASIEEIGNGWFRITVSATQGAGTSVKTVLLLQDSAGLSTFTGDGVSSLLIWNGQFEAGAYSTSPIATTSSQVTRLADLSVTPLANLNNLGNQGNGTIVAESFVNNGAAVVKCFAALTDGSLNNRMMLHVSTLTPGCVVSAGALAQVSQAATPVALGSAVKLALAFSANNFAISFSGAAVQLDTDGSIPIVDRLEIGSYAGAGWPNAPIKRVAIYSVRLGDTFTQSVARI